MPAKKRVHPVVLSIPINLRQFFESATARNFFSTINVGYHFGEGTHELKDVIQRVSESFQRDLSGEQLYSQLNQFISLEQNPVTRAIPLPLKDYILRIANIIRINRLTSSISNIGRITMPSEFDPYIRQFSLCTSASARSPLITMCTYGDRMVVSFTSLFRETDIQRTFFQLLSKEGISIDISSNIKEVETHETL
jgi:hypothetical protein